jgi:membrane dipeptidase
MNIFDGHNDTLTNLHLRERGKGRSFFAESEVGHIDLPRALRGGLIGGVFAIFTPPPLDSPERDPLFGLTVTDDGYDVVPRTEIDHAYSVQFTDAVLESLNGMIREADGAVQHVRTATDIEECVRCGRFAVVLGFEGAEAIREDLSNLEGYYQLGLRVLGPVWSRPNRFAEGVPFRFPGKPDTGPGLTASGRELVRESNRLGIVIDLAHINLQGFWDVAQLSQAPLVVSHTDVHSLCSSTRNITDAQIDAVGKSGGVIGINFEPRNTRADGKYVSSTPVSSIVEHIKYVADRIGIDHVAFGSDFDGASMSEDLSDVSKLPHLIAALEASGFDCPAIEKIAFGNWLRVFKETWKYQPL